VKAVFRRRNTQRGVALLALVAVAVMVFAYLLTSRLHSAAGPTAVNREHNGKVLNQAKQALIGWMVLNAAQTDNNPGRLPCPEAVNSINTSSEGVSAPQIALPGPPAVPATPNCATVGRLPWRTLGLDKLVDAASEPLWYAVSPGWALQNSTTLLTINSDSRGAMVVDGQAAPNDVVALIIAPGRAMNVQTATGCTARAQARAAPAPAMDPRDYLECFNAATPAYSTVGPTVKPAESFNDQVLKVTTADLLPALEAAIAQRMQREIAPALKSVYGSATWGTSAANPLYPFAARFDNPHPGAASYRGEDGRYQGLLPFSSSSATCGADPRCTTTFVSWNTGVAPTISVSGGVLVAPNCTVTATTVQCTGLYVGLGGTLSMTARAQNVAMALRTLAPSNMTIESGLLGYGPAQPGTSASGDFNTNGSADLTLRANMPGILFLTLMFRFTANLGVLADHPLLDPSSVGPGSTGWFVRNEWYRLVYYAAAQESTADGLPAHGCTSSDCLRVNDPATRNIRALLVLAGRSLSNPAGRPNATLSDYLEYQNSDLGTIYEQRPVRTSRASIPALNAPFNDRLVLVDWIAPNPTFPLAALP